MNKHLYRIIFNIKRGQRMAVSETAVAQGKGGSGETGGGLAGSLICALRPLKLAIHVALGGLLSIASVQAQIIADPTAPASQRPTVLQTANNLPQVNIQTPSAAGVSRNSYSQFDVVSQGAILNNSRTDVSTQLGGWVQANPWLAGGSARVILNEVDASSPSQLKGYVEVAGQRAEVIIANPAGIAVNGGGFLNASSVTLTTGTPILNGGSLESYRVQRGSVSIDGAGLDTRAADYTSILARAVQVNADLWAKDLKVVTGTNDIAASNAAAPVVNGLTRGTGVTPAYALDVAQIGGMYAGKILLVGTEAGLGVRSAGIMGATAGDVVLQNNGWLSHSGSIWASGNTHITTEGEITNSGTLYASSDTLLTSQSGSITLAAGLIAAQGNTSLRAAAQVSAAAGSALAAGLNPDGSITSTGNLTVNASQTVALNGQTRAGGDAQVSASQLNLASGTVTAQNINLSATNGDILASAASLSAQTRLQASAAARLITDGANVSATQLQLAAHDLSNRGGEILQTGTTDMEMALVGNLNNTLGRIASNSHNLSLTTTALTNTDGRIEHAGGGVLTLNTGDVYNAGGVLATQGDITAHGLNVDNTAGLIRSAQSTSLIASTVINSNTQGTDQGIEGSNIAISATTFSNDTGAIRADNNITITSSGHFNNRAGLISAANTLVVQDLSASKVLELSNTGGRLIAGHSASVNAASLSGDGQVLSKADLSVALTTDFNNTNMGEVAANGSASISSTGTITNSGTLQAGNTLDLTATNIDNTATLVGGSVKLQASQSVLNRGPEAFIGASDSNGLLQILAHDIINRDDATSTDTVATTSIIGLGSVVLAGGMDGAGNHTAAATVRNESAYISSGADMGIVANTLTNTRRVLQTSDTYVPTGSTVLGQVVWSPSTPDVPGGRYIEPPHGGYMNSDYLYTDYQGTFARNSITQISPKAVIEVGGNLNPALTRLQNYWSAVTAAGNVPLNGVTLDQDGWQNGNSLNPGTAVTPLGESATYSGTYVYQTYRGSIWTNSWGPTSPVVTPLAGYDTSLTAGGTISGSGNTVINTSGVNPNTPLGSQSGLPQNPAITSGHPLSNFRLPSGGLFHTNPNPASRYLIETNPAFTSKQQWISSDYFFAQLGLDPSKIQKRLGDAFYEQQLIKEQLIGLTGRAILDYPDLQSQYQALMRAGAAYAKQLNLAPGVALSAGQVAQLSSDMVIMQEIQVDGQVVLVPVVYLAAYRAASLLPTGSLISANNIALVNSQNITSSGTIRTQQTLSLDAQDIDNRGGRLQSGALMQLTSQNNIDLTSASLKAGNLSLGAGKNILLNTDARQVSSTVQGGIRQSTQFGQTASIEVTGDAFITTGANLEQNAGNISIGGDLQTNIGGNWTLGALQNSEITRAQTATGHSSTDVVQQRTSSLSVGGASKLQVTNDFSALGAAITLQGPANLQTGGNLSLSAVNDSIRVDSASASSRHSETTRSNNETVRGTTLQAGSNLSLISGQDIILQGSSLSAVQGNATLLAEGDVKLLSEGERHQSDINHIGTHSGLISSSVAEHNTINAVNAVVSGLAAQNLVVIADKNLTSYGTQLQGQDSLYVDGKDTSAFYEVSSVKETQSTTQSSWGFLGITLENKTVSDSLQSSLALGSQLISQNKIGIGVANHASFSGAELEAPQIRFTQTDANKAGELLLGASVNTTQTAHAEKNETAGVWQAMAGNGSTVQTLKQTTLNGIVTFDTALKITAQIPETQGGTELKSLIQQLAAQTAGLDYLNQLANKPNVQWDKVALANEHWSYSQQGLTPAGAALLSIAVAAYAPGLSSGITSSITSTAGAGTAAAFNAGFISLQAQAAVALVNNSGDIGKTLNQLGSSDSIKGLLTTMATAGALNSLDQTLGFTNSTQSVTGQTGVGSLGANGVATSQAANQFGQNLLKNITNNVASAAIDAAISGKPFNADSLSKALSNALSTAGMAAGANAIGEAIVESDISSFTGKFAHLVLGCAGGMTAGSTCDAGALGAVVGEMAAEYINPEADPALREKTLAFAKTLAAVAGVLTGGGDDNAAAVNAAATTGANAAENNWLGDHQKAAMNKEMKAAQSNLEKLKVAGKYLVISGKQDILTTTGIGLGLADAGWTDVRAFAQFMNDPVAGLQGIKRIIADPDTRAALGDQIIDALIAKIDRISVALVEGGDEAAMQLGKGIGSLAWQVGTVVTGVMGATALTNAGINISASAFDAMTAAKAVKAAENAQLVASQLNNFYRDSAPASLIQKTLDVAAQRSTQNAAASEVVLGRYIEGSTSSYDAIAQARDSTYFSMSDWNTVRGQLGQDQMWSINKAFLDQQMMQGKSFLFTADPRTVRPDSYTALEFKHLTENGYRLQLINGEYRAVIK